MAQYAHIRVAEISLNADNWQTFNIMLFWVQYATQSVSTAAVING